MSEFIIKYLFHNKHKNITVLELILDDKTLPKDKRCHWIFINNESGTLKRIPFKSKNTNIIYFKGGKLTFTENMGFFNFGKSYVRLDRLNNNLKLLPQIDKLLHDYLDKECEEEESKITEKEETTSEESTTSEDSDNEYKT